MTARMALIERLPTPPTLFTFRVEELDCRIHPSLICLHLPPFSFFFPPRIFVFDFALCSNKAVASTVTDWTRKEVGSSIHAYPITVWTGTCTENCYVSLRIIQYIFQPDYNVCLDIASRFHLHLTAKVQFKLRTCSFQEEVK
mmetsp:Transcript_14387/g.36693  ORF Transcript_14387/g.36693 Transcript_14387/m.36693 type:complete len:142 (+) Transcript_14387:2545-2970(+)